MGADTRPLLMFRFALAAQGQRQEMASSGCDGPACGQSRATYCPRGPGPEPLELTQLTQAPWLSVVLEKRTPCHPKFGLGPATGHIMSWDTLDTTPDLQGSTRFLSSSTAIDCVLLLECHGGERQQRR